MRPALAFLGGALLIWIVANGKAADVWDAIAGKPAARAPDPSTHTTPPNTQPSTPIPSYPPRIA